MSIQSVRDACLAIRKGRGPFGAGSPGCHCFKSPQYFWAPLSQQPVFRHIDWRMPQLVMQIDSVERSGFFLQLLIQMVSSPLQRMGAASVLWEKSRVIPMKTISPVTILCGEESGTGESERRFMATF
jgi:hypothetical protein